VSSFLEYIYVDWLAFLFQIIGSVLLAKKNLLAWVFFIAGNILWLIYFIFWHPNLVVAIIQTTFFILLDIYGLWSWKKSKK
jgi:hypothetical protein